MLIVFPARGLRGDGRCCGHYKSSPSKDCGSQTLLFIGACQSKFSA
jgi:hypothetical protein